MSEIVSDVESFLLYRIELGLALAGLFCIVKLGFGPKYDVILAKNKYALLIISGSKLYFISPLTSSFSYNTKMSMRLIPNKVFSTSFDKLPR